MASGWTNKGKYRALGILFRNDSEPTNFYVALVTAATSPTVDTNTLGDLTQIATGNGYTDGGYQLARNSTDFDTHTEDDTNDRGVIQVKDIAWTASGGTIPASGNPIRWLVLTDDNGTVASREVYAWFDPQTTITIADTATQTFQNLTLRAV